MSRQTTKRETRPKRTFSKALLDGIFAYFTTVSPSGTTANVVDHVATAEEQGQDWYYKYVHSALYKLQEENLIHWNRDEQCWTLVRYRNQLPEKASQVPIKVHDNTQSSARHTNGNGKEAQTLREIARLMVGMGWSSD